VLIYPKRCADEINYSYFSIFSTFLHVFKRFEDVCFRTVSANSRVERLPRRVLSWFSCLTKFMTRHLMRYPPFKLQDINRRPLSILITKDLLSVFDNRLRISITLLKWNEPPTLESSLHQCVGPNHQYFIPSIIMELIGCEVGTRSFVATLGYRGFTGCDDGLSSARYFAT